MFDRDRAIARLAKDLFHAPVLDNALRGYLCEYYLAEALGPECAIVSSGWNAWDLQIGPGAANFPERVRIQVKASARRQIWHTTESIPSDPLFVLNWRSRPAYHSAQSPNVPCEDRGFLCELFALCYHDEVDPDRCDQSDPAQWQVFLLPADPAFGAITAAELRWLQRHPSRSASLHRRPDSMRAGIRGRLAIPSIPLTEVRIGHIRTVLGLK